MDALTIATIALALLTGYYAWQTRSTVVEITKHRKGDALPVLLPKVLKFNGEDPNQHDQFCIDCEIENIGNGPAFNILVTLFDADKDEKLTQSVNSIDYLTKNSISDNMHIHISAHAMKHLSYQEVDNEMISFIKISLSYLDLYGEDHLVEREFAYKNVKSPVHPVHGSFKLNH